MTYAEVLLSLIEQHLGAIVLSFVILDLLAWVGVIQVFRKLRKNRDPRRS